jgi:hypothetical protein
MAQVILREPVPAFCSAAQTSGVLRSSKILTAAKRAIRAARSGLQVSATNTLPCTGSGTITVTVNVANLSAPLETGWAMCRTWSMRSRRCKTR